MLATQFVYLSEPFVEAIYVFERFWIGKGQCIWPKAYDVPVLPVQPDLSDIWSPSPNVPEAPAVSERRQKRPRILVQAMIEISFCNVGAEEDDDEREPMLSGNIHKIFQHDQTIRACAVRGEELTSMGKFVSEILGILSQSTFLTMVSDIVCDISAFLPALNPMIQLRRILRGQFPAYRCGQIPDYDYRKHRSVSFKRSDQFKMDTMQLSVSQTTRGTLTIGFQLDWRRRVRSQHTGAADTSYFYELKSRAVVKRALVSSAVSHAVVVVGDPVDAGVTRNIPYQACR